MAINFPNTPSVNELYSFNGKTWQWNGIYWEVYSALTSYITSVYTVGDGISSISGVSGGNVALKSFSGFNITIADSGDKLTFSSNNYDAGVITNSTGWTNNGNGTMNLPQVQVALYDNPNYLGPVKVYTVASGVTGSGGISGITDNDTNYIYIEYNGGNPRWVVSTDNSAINDSDVVRFQTVYRIGNFIHNLEWGDQGAGLPNKITDRIDATDRFARESGLSLGLSGATGVVTLSSGIAWNGTNRQSLAAVNSQDDIFFQNFHSGGTWTFVTTGNTLNNVYYDDGTDRVVASAGTYLVNWYFRGQEINDHLYEVWGNDEYVSVSEAQLSTEPNLPELITSHAVLVGRIIVQVGATTGVVESAFVRVFQPTTVQEHNDLTGIQGGSAGQYYHLNSNQYNNLALTNTTNTFTSQQNFDVLSANTISGGTLYGDGSGLTNVVLSVSASTGLSGNSTTGNITLINTAPDQTVTITGGTNIEIAGSYPNFGINFTGTTTSTGDYLPLSGGTVTGATIFQSGLTANTISATTYLNLPVSNFTGGTVSGATNFTDGLTANTISATTYQNLPIDPDTYVTNFTYDNANTFILTQNSGTPFSATVNIMTGLTINGDFNVTGNTTLNNLSANTISATTISGGTFYGDGSNLINVDNIYNNDGSLAVTNPSFQRIVDLNFNTLIFRQDPINLGGVVISGGTIQPKSIFLKDGSGVFELNLNVENDLSVENDLTVTGVTQVLDRINVAGDFTTNYLSQDARLSIQQENKFRGILFKPYTGNTTFGINAQSDTFGNKYTGLNFETLIDYSANYDFPSGFRFDVSGIDIPTETTPSSGLLNFSFFSGTTYANPVTNRSLITINNGPGVGIFNTPVLKIFANGNLALNSGSDQGNKLQVNSASDPIRATGMQVLNTDTEVVTIDSNGVLHKRTYDYVTGFTYTPSQNKLTITTTSGNSYSASINTMTGLTINGDLNVTGNYFVSGDTIVSGNTVFTGTTTYNTVPNAIGDFLTLPTSNVMSRRTSHQVRDDIGYYGLTFAMMNGYF
jgi:hypothetical protein